MSLRTITVTDQKTLHVGALSNCKMLKTVVLEEGLEKINYYSFYRCESLESLSLPSTLKRIDNQAVKYCLSLKNIKLPEGLESIGECAFEETVFESIVIPKTVTTLGQLPFRDCDALKKVTLQSGMAQFDSRYCFDGCSSIERVEIPASVSFINEKAFEDCDSPNLTIYGETGSYAQTFAEAHNIPFKQQTAPDPTPTPKPTPSPDEIKKITLSQKKAKIFAGREPLVLTAAITPATAGESEVIGISSKPDVATVESGVVTPLKVGKTVITCKAAVGKAKATCTVTVKPVPVSSLTVDPTTLTVVEGKTVQLTATVLPDDATNQVALFKSSKPKIASVDSYGTVTGLKPGKSVITVSVKGYGKKVKIPVTVVAAVE